jgi:multidrug efflux pump subunit AcrA (membrane-fusion protein)
MKWLEKILKSRRKWAVLGLVLILGSGLVGWRVWAGKKEAGSQLQTVAVEQGMIISSVSASGQVLSVNLMSANTKASGIVTQVYVQDGVWVNKGDKILQIDLDFQGEQKNTQAWASYLSAKNSLASARASQYGLQAEMFGKWDTFKELAESDDYKDTDSINRTLPEFHIPEKEWLETEAKYKNQEAVINQAQVALNNSWLEYQLTSAVITAPTDGVITSLMYAPGMSIGSLDTGSSESNQKVATIKTQGLPIVSVNLSEIDVSRVELGQKATITLDSIADKTFTGKVMGVDRIGETSSGVTQYPALIQLDSSAEEILPNMTVTAQIVIARKDQALLVPSGVVKTQGGQSYVMVLVDNKEQAVAVETGLTSDTQTEIVSGLSEGDLVVNSSLAAGSGDNESSPFGSSGMRMMRIPH